MKDYDAIAREYDVMKKRGTELDNLVPVKARIGKNPRMVFSIRLTPQELTQLSQAAAQRKVTISDFIRLAALGAANGELGLDAGERAAALNRVQTQIEELAETAKKLGAA